MEVKSRTVYFLCSPQACRDLFAGELIMVSREQTFTSHHGEKRAEKKFFRGESGKCAISIIELSFHITLL